MMLIQTRFVIDIFLGRDSGWNSQNRNEAALPFEDAFKHHAFHLAAGIAFAATSYVVSWAALLWFSPIIAGLILSPVISWATSRADFGRWLWKMNVFRIPEETIRAAAKARPSRIAYQPQNDNLTHRIIAAE
jgi:membrane glycosyltransferase